MDTLECGTPSRRARRSSAEADAILWGNRVSHDWRIERTIGQGGMGVVYAAKHVTTGEAVAIKVLGDVHLRDPRAAARFAREIRVAMKLGSEHVARVRSVGRLPTGEPMMVMELLEGEDLGALAKRRRTLGIDESVRFIAQVCDAVGEAHDAGVVHRDLKLANLFLCQKPGRASIVKVLDFGLAKATERPNDDSALTEAGTCLGTPHYMAPEMFNCSRDVDARVDVWALGVCLYRLVTGMLPYHGLSMVGLCAQILHGELTLPRSIRPELPKDVEDVILRCLARDPMQRFANARTLGRALTQCLRTQKSVQSFTRLHVATKAPPSSSPREEEVTVVESRGHVDDAERGARLSGPVPDSIPAVHERTTAPFPIAPIAAQQIKSPLASTFEPSDTRAALTPIDERGGAVRGATKAGYALSDAPPPRNRRSAKTSPSLAPCSSRNAPTIVVRRHRKPWMRLFAVAACATATGLAIAAALAHTL